MAHLPDFEGWAIFARVAELGSFTAAADDLNLSKATVSKAVSRLEARLGATLFHRTSRRLSLTGTGHASLERAARILSEGEAIEEEATAQSAEPRGLVRITAPVSFGVQHLAPLLPGFMDYYPKISVDLHLSDNFVDIVAEGFDIALRIAVLHDSSLRARRLCAVRGLISAAPAYLEKYGRPAHPRELDRHVGIFYSNLAHPDIWTLRHPIDGECQIRLGSRFATNSGEAMLPALFAGQGLTFLPEFFVSEALADGRLEEVLPGWSTGDTSLHLVSPPNPLRPARVQALIDYLAQAYVKPPWERT